MFLSSVGRKLFHLFFLEQGDWSFSKKCGQDIAPNLLTFFPLLMQNSQYLHNYLLWNMMNNPIFYNKSKNEIGKKTLIWGQSKEFWILTFFMKANLNLGRHSRQIKDVRVGHLASDSIAMSGWTFSQIQNKTFFKLYLFKQVHKKFEE